MSDHFDKSNPDKLGGSHSNKSQSREGDLASDAVGLPLLIDDPAPLSDALNIPTLIDEKPDAKAPERNRSQLVKPPAEGFDRFGRNRAAPENPRPQNANRATTPAGEPRHDAGTFIGVPSNHPQTEAGAKLAKLDKVALFVGAIVVIGPLAAAMLGRMGM